MTHVVEVKVRLTPTGDGSIVIDSAEILAEGVDDEAIPSIVLAGLLGHVTQRMVSEVEEMYPLMNADAVAMLAVTNGRLHVMHTLMDLPYASPPEGDAVSVEM